MKWLRIAIFTSVSVTLGSSLSAEEVVMRHVLVDANGPVDPWGKSVGDLNGDQKVDLIVGGRKSGGLVWYESPSWQRHVIAQDGKWSTDHEAVDIDQDGDLDVVALTTDSVRWYENPSWTEHRIDRRVLHDIEVADFDGDGDVDLVGRDQGEFGHSGATLHFYHQESPLRWEHHSIDCPDGEGLAVGDIDGDGDPDVIINSTWIENSDGRIDGDSKQHPFAERWMHSATFVALADVNQDGRLDIIHSPAELAGQRYRISWFESPRDPSDGFWTEHVIAYDVEAVHHFVGAADMNLDGDVDIITAEMQQGQDPDEVVVHHNAGNGTSWSKQTLASTGSHSMRLFDHDNDGDMDLFGANWQGRTVDLWVNETNDDGPPLRQGWTHLVIDQQRTSKQFGIGWGDVDRDGDLDIASGQYVYINPGAKMGNRWHRITLPGEVDANFVTDIDGDANADILAQHLPHVYWLEATDATGTAYTSRRVATGLGVTGHGSSQGFSLGELVGGGKPEYVLTTGDGIYYLQIPDDPNSAAWPKVQITDRAPEEGIAVGDLDGDRLNDVVSWVGTGSGSRQLGWWKNPGTDAGNWQLHPIGQVAGDEGDRIAVGDFNQDGELDVVATGTTNSDRGSAVYWFKNPGQKMSDVRSRDRGNRHWDRMTIGDDLGAMNSMSVGDMNQDGMLDVITGEHRGEKRTVLWLNRKAGASWFASVVDRGKESHLGAQVADLDTDGDLDIISIGWDDHPTLRLWRNDQVTTE